MKVDGSPTVINLIYFYPHFMLEVFLVFLYFARIPSKGEFILRALVAVTVATALAHVNRWFYIWPEYLYFPSGHMTFCFGIAISLGMLRPWTLAVTLPLLVPFGKALYIYRFHTYLDVFGAIPLVLIVYGIVHWYWRIPPKPRPLDMGTDSP